MEVTFKLDHVGMCAVAFDGRVQLKTSLRERSKQSVEHLNYKSIVTRDLSIG